MLFISQCSSSSIVIDLNDSDCCSDVLDISKSENVKYFIKNL